MQAVVKCGGKRGTAEHVTTRFHWRMCPHRSFLQCLQERWCKTPRSSSVHRYAVRSDKDVFPFTSQEIVYGRALASLPPQWLLAFAGVWDYGSPPVEVSHEVDVTERFFYCGVRKGIPGRGKAGDGASVSVLQHPLPRLRRLFVESVSGSQDPVLTRLS